MTTIATDGRTVAADGLQVCGDEPVAHDMKKLKIVDGTLYGITGAAPVFGPAIEWYRNGANPSEAPKCDGWGLIVFGDKAAVRITDKCPYPDTFSYPVAFGSGADFAVAALKLGKTPREAVELAATCNVFTGGAIMEMDIPRTAKIREAAE